MTEEKKVELNAENLESVAGGGLIDFIENLFVKKGSSGGEGQWTMPNDHRPVGGEGQWTVQNDHSPVETKGGGNITNTVSGQNNKVYQQGKEISFGGNSINKF